MSWSSFGEQEQPNKDPALLRFAGSRGDHQCWGRAGMDEVEQEQPPHLRASEFSYFSFPVSFMNPTQKIVKVIPFAADSGKGQQPPTMAVTPLKLVLI